MNEMNTLKEATAFVKGLAEGLDLDLNKKESKILRSPL